MGVEKRTQNWIIVGVVLLVAIIYPLWKVQTGEPAIKQGIDLVGGVDLLLQARVPEGHEEITQDMMQGAISIVRNRLDPEGVKEIIIQQMGVDRIVVQIPGEDDPERVKNLIGHTAMLRFIDSGDDPIPQDTKIRFIDANTGQPIDIPGLDFDEPVEDAFMLTPDQVLLQGIGITGFFLPSDLPREEVTDTAEEESTEEPVEISAGQDE
ncbi:MAG TPA: hypothetical protein ENN67_01090, partial [Firmicutes bacterium]|nr:hypothetical protein [Bacillota bacterium]